MKDELKSINKWQAAFIANIIQSWVVVHELYTPSTPKSGVIYPLVLPYLMTKGYLDPI